MIEINLLPDRLRTQKTTKWNFLRSPLALTVGSVIALLLIGQILLTLSLAYRYVELSFLRTRIAQLTVLCVPVAARKAEILSLNAKWEEIGDLTRRPFYWASFLSDLSESVTKGVWLRSLRVERGQNLAVLRLEGSVLAPGQETAFIGRFIKQMKDHPGLSELLEEIELSNINQKKIKDYDVYDFVLNCTFKKGKL